MEILKLGSKGKQVVELKNRLFILGYLDISEENRSIFDAKEEEAVKKFQKDKNLKIDGIVGVKTNEALFEAIWPSSLSGRALFNRGLKQERFLPALLDYNEAIKRDKNIAEAYYRRGMLYAYATEYADIKRNINKASNDFSEAIKINPDYVEAYLERGMIHDENKDWKSAIDDWTQAILIEPDNIEAYYRRAKAKQHLKNTKDIINDYIKVIQLKFNLEQDVNLKKQVEQVITNFHNNQVSPELMLVLSRGVASTGISDILSTKEYSYSSTEAPESLESLIEDLEKAIKNFQNQQDQNIFILLYYYKALTEYEFEYAFYFGDLKYGHLQTFLLKDLDLKNYSKINIFASTHYYRGLLFQDKDKQEEAKEEFDKAIERQPNFTKAYYSRGIIRSKQGDEQGAISDFKKYLQGDPEMAEAKKMRKAQYASFVIAEEIEACFNQEISKEYLETLESSSVPLEASAYLRRGKLRFLLGDYPGAKRDFQEVIKADPNLAADAYYQKGKVAAYIFYVNDFNYDMEKAQEIFDEAIKSFDEAIKINSNFSEAYFERGYLKYKSILKKNSEDYGTTGVAFMDDSQNDFKQAIKLDKSFAQAYYLMVVTERYKSYIQLFKQDTGEEAIQWEKIKLSPTDINNLTEAIRSDIYFYSDFIGFSRLTMKRAVCVDLGSCEQDNTTKSASIIPFKSKEEEIYYTLALGNYRKKEYKQAIENITQAIKLNPEISDFYLIRGAAYYFDKDNIEYYKAALKDFKASIQLEPELTPVDLLQSDYRIPNTTYSSSISHFLIGRIIEDQDISQKEYQTALSYLPQADWSVWTFKGEGGGSQTQNTGNSA